MKRTICVACVAAISGSASAALVELRIVERTGQAVASPGDDTLDFAVQARVNSSTLALGGYGFDIRFFGEAESWGQLSRGRITSLSDFTYTNEVGGPAPGFHSGLPGHMRYLAGLNSAFNGLINTSGANFTNTPDQEIGLVNGLSWQSSFLSIPGVDSDGDGRPDFVAEGQDTGRVPTSILSEFFAQEQWIDIYRFRYRVSSFTNRLLDIGLVSSTRVGAEIFDGVVTNSPTVGWGYRTQSSPDLVVHPWSGTVVPSVPTAGMLLGGLMLSVRRRVRR